MTTSEIFNLFLLSILILLVSYHFIYKSILHLIEIGRIKKNGEKAFATIVETIKTRGPDGEIIFHAVFKYTTHAGQVITAPRKYTKGIQPRIGKELTLYYLRDSPDKFYISRSLPHEMVPIMMATAGLIFCIFELLKIAGLFSDRL